jgi:hypothetical protein
VWVVIIEQSASPRSTSIVGYRPRLAAKTGHLASAVPPIPTAKVSLPAGLPSIRGYGSIDDTR